MKADKIWNLLCKMASIVDRARRHILWFQDTMSNRDAMIIVTKRRSLVNDTRAICIRNIGVHHDTECLIFELKTKYDCE